MFKLLSLKRVSWGVLFLVLCGPLLVSMGEESDEVLPSVPSEGEEGGKGSVGDEGREETNVDESGHLNDPSVIEVDGEETNNGTDATGNNNTTIDQVAADVKASKEDGQSAATKSIKFKVSCWDPRKDTSSLSSTEELIQGNNDTDGEDLTNNSLPVPQEIVAEGEGMVEDQGTASVTPETNEVGAAEETGQDNEANHEGEASSDPGSNDDDYKAENDTNNLSLKNRTVEIVNLTHLTNEVLYQNPAVKSKTNPGNCTIVMFYAPWCPFSAKAAPHFNALPRVYPPLKVVAIDAYQYKQVNTFFGILGVPTVALFHNGRLIAKFNDSQFTLNKFSDFIEHFTDLKHEERMNVTTKDFEGPLPSTPTKERDWLLLIAWVFIIASCTHYITKSAIWWRFVEFVRATWMEAEEAEHEHID